MSAEWAVRDEQPILPTSTNPCIPREAGSQRVNPPSKAAPPPARAQNQTRQQTHPCDKGQLPAQLKTSPPARTAEPAPLVGIGNQLNLPLFVTQPPKMNSHTVPPPTPLPLHHDQPAGTRPQQPDPASKTRPIHNSNQTTAPFLWETSLPWGRPPAAY